VIVRPLFRSLSRPLFRALSGAVSAITKVLIDLSLTSNGFYSLGTPAVFAADFEISGYFYYDGANIVTILGNSLNNNNFLEVSTSGVITSRISGATSSSASSAVSLNILNKFKWYRAGSVVKLELNGVQIISYSTSLNLTLDFIGRSNTGNFFGGIISDLKLTNITTPANSLEFKFDQLTANTETNNGVTLTYNNIGTGTSVRDTYTLIDGDYIGSEIAIDGDFAGNDDTYWNAQQGWSISSNRANHSTGSNSNLFYRGNPLTAGYLYTSTYTVLNVVSPNSDGVNIRIGGGGGGVNYKANGTYTQEIVATNTELLFTAQSLFLGAIDDVSVKRVIEVA
jgi:hypothetical protein